MDAKWLKCILASERKIVIIRQIFEVGSGSVHCHIPLGYKVWQGQRRAFHQSSVAKPLVLHFWRVHKESLIRHDVSGVSFLTSGLTVYSPSPSDWSECQSSSSPRSSVRISRASSSRSSSTSYGFSASTAFAFSLIFVYSGLPAVPARSYSQACTGFQPTRRGPFQNRRGP